MAVAELKQRRSNPTSFTVATGTAIPKGTIMELTDPRTAIAMSASGSVVAGILARDFVAGQLLTEAPLFTDGIFAILVSGSTTVGLAVSAASSGSVTLSPVTRKGRMILGHALATGADNATVQIELNIGGGGNQIT